MARSMARFVASRQPDRICDWDTSIASQEHSMSDAIIEATAPERVAREDAHRETEVKIAVKALNSILELGRPTSTRTA
jgi:hypothetical protein